MSNPISWSDLPNLQQDNVTVQIDAGMAPKGYIEFQLVLSPHLSWRKALNAWDASGNLLDTCSVQDDNKGPEAFYVPIAILDKLELVKAKAFGVMTGMYALNDFAGKDGARITFTWNKD
jgi:hypothetical protein